MTTPLSAPKPAASRQASQEGQGNAGAALRFLESRSGSFLRCHERGQAMVEYLVASAVVLILIAVPVDGSDSAVDLLLRAVQTAYHRFLSTMSLPL